MSDTGTDNPLPNVETNLDAPSVFSALHKLSKQGKLPGYEHQSGSESAIADAHGNPFDSDLLMTYLDQSVRFELKLRPKLPAVFALLLLLTVCPGLQLTDSFMLNYEWYERLMGESIKTWMWYLPLTVLPIPFVWRSTMKKSRASARAHAIETIEKIRSIVG